MKNHRIAFTVLLGASVLLMACPPSIRQVADIRINEFLASNDSALFDEDGDASDWIELYNAGELPASLGGWALTDDPSVPDKWVFPDVILGVGDYWVVFASGKNRRLGELHTNFRLDKSGEYLALFDPDGNTRPHNEFSPRFPGQVTDSSYGRTLGDAFQFLNQPTPSAANNLQSAFSGRSGNVTFMPDHGFFDQSIEVLLTSAMPGSQVRYTLDGSHPSETNGLTYMQPINVAVNAVIRAVSFTDGFLPSEAETRTYLINTGEAIRSLPALSIVGDEEESLYSPNGIMAIVGGEYAPTWQPVNAADYNNAMQRGRAFERPVSAELIWPDGSEGFSYGCGIRVQGSDYHRQRYRAEQDWTDCSNGYASWSKFSFRLYFRDEYGPSKLNYPLISESSVVEYDRLVLRGGLNDQCNPFVIDELSRRLHADMGAVASLGTFVSMFLNGDYKGYYNVTERIDEAFLTDKLGGGEDWDVLGFRDRDSPGSFDVNAGSEDALLELLEIVNNEGLSDDAAYDEVENRFDIEAFIDYLIVQLYIANADWIRKNWIIARERSEGGKFRFYLWDAEFSMLPEFLTADGFRQFPVWTANGGAGLNGDKGIIATIYRALKSNRRFENQFHERIAIHFSEGGALTQENVDRRFQELRNAMAGHLPAMDTYIPDVFIPNRAPIILAAFEREGLYAAP